MSINQKLPHQSLNISSDCYFSENGIENWNDWTKARDFLIAKLLRDIASPSWQLVEDMGEILRSLLAKKTKDVFKRFPAVIECVLEMSALYIKERMLATREKIQASIASDSQDIYSLYSDACRGEKRMSESHESFRNWMNHSIIKVERYIQDRVTRAIGFHLIRRVHQDIPPKVHVAVLNASSLTAWTPTQGSQERRKLTRTLRTLDDAMNLLERNRVSR